MCGIAGIHDGAAVKQPEHDELQRMVARLHHRGPDGVGIHLRGPVGLAHSRLSIIDLEGGAQPIHNEDGSIWVIFNGEIFNYVELQADLRRKGHSFYTQSDTEVIVHLYEEYGDDFVSYLNGQFAIALWDENRKRLLLIRDRVGIHPLFYSQQQGRLVFASEVKAMLPVFHNAPSLNAMALDQIMTFWAPVAPETIFEGVYQVLPGEMIIATGASLTKQRYWDWCFPENDDYYPVPESQQAEELCQLLLDATRLRLRSDVPVGAYLSGGLDSSALTALIHQQGTELRTFSIGFEQEGFDESGYQQQMINHLGADHSRIQCVNADIGAAFERAIWHTETPILRTAPVPMMLLSGLVHDNGYKVVLTGEGADEVLGGYDIFKEGKIRSFWAKNPDSRLRPQLLKRLYPYLDISSVQGQAYLEAFFGAGIREPAVPYFSHIPRWNTTASCKVFFSSDLQAEIKVNAMDRIKDSWPAAMANWHGFNQAQYIEAKTLMAGYLLCSQGDRMLMANSVEGRFPFLDHRVIEFANRLHPNVKMKVLKEKYILKKAMAPYLPKSIVSRHKQPYRAPDIPAFFSGVSPAYVQDMLSESTLTNYGYFDAKKVGRLLNKIGRGRAIGAKDNMALVGILSTQLWHRLFVESKQN